MRKIAISHDFLFQYGGAEKVLEEMLHLYANEDITIYTSFYIPEKFPDSSLITKFGKIGKIKTTPINWFMNLRFKGKPILAKYQRHFFWLYPLMMKTHTLKGYDVVIVNHTDCAKQVRIIA